MLSAIVFDFDGVIIESADIKTRAFAALFRDSPDKVDDIVAYHLENSGLSRYEKFRYIYKQILGVQLTDDRIETLDREFSRIVSDEIRQCPLVPGVIPFLERHLAELPLFIASATPHQELLSIVRDRGLATYFKSIHGSPASKTSLLRMIQREVGKSAETLLFIGDSLNDYHAAVEVGMRFVGRVDRSSGTSPFDGLPILVIEDFNHLEHLWPVAAL